MIRRILTTALVVTGLIILSVAASARPSSGATSSGQITIPGPSSPSPAVEDEEPDDGILVPPTETGDDDPDSHDCVPSAQNGFCQDEPRTPEEPGGSDRSRRTGDCYSTPQRTTETGRTGTQASPIAPSPIPMQLQPPEPEVPVAPPAPPVCSTPKYTG